VCWIGYSSDSAKVGNLLALQETWGCYNCPHWQPVRVRPGLLARLCPTLGLQSFAPIAEATRTPSETVAGRLSRALYLTDYYPHRPSDHKGARGEVAGVVIG